MRSHDVVAANVWVLATLPALVVAIVVAVVVPLVLAVTGVPARLRLAAWIAGAIAAIGLCAVDAGTIAVVTIAPYAAVCAIAGLVGISRLRRGPTSQIALAVALMFLPAAAMWLVAARAGYALLGYPPFWVILTAAHFHVAGACLIAIAGRVAAARGGRLAPAIAIGCMAAVPLTAAGIYGPRWLELGAALVMAVSAFGVGGLLVTTRGIAKRIAGAVLLGSMPLAGAYALRDQAQPFVLGGLDPLASMVIAHGAPNALAFALIALAAFAGETSSDPKSSAEN